MKCQFSTPPSLPQISRPATIYMCLKYVIMLDSMRLFRTVPVAADTKFIWLCSENAW